jgi:ferritin-like metal-binding protein YciE
MSKLYKCLETELAEIYDAEKQLTKTLLKLANSARHDELKSAFFSHQVRTEEHVRRLEKVFGILEIRVASRKCRAMQALIAECEARIDDDLGDAALICAAQKIEHYELATYGCLRSWAQLMDFDEAADLIEETLDDENDADEHLTALAVQIVNLDAGDPEEDEEMDIEHAARQGASGGN